MGRRPNILFFFSDQHRGDWMPYDPKLMREQGVPDLELHMPNIRGLMERGTTFTQAYSPAPVCAPARACLASGRRYRNCRVYQNNVNYDPKLPCFYAALREHGYFVTGVGKFDLNKADLDWGDGFHSLLRQMGFSDASDSEGKMDTVWAAMDAAPGPYGRMLAKHGLLDAYCEDMVSRGRGDTPTPLPGKYYADNWIGEKSRDMLMRLPKSQPWFMQVNFSGPHDPWDVTVEMKDRVRNRRFPLAAGCTKPEENQRIRQNYAAMIENIDRIVGDCICVLDQLGMLDNTLIVYSSDHGELMGDHDLYGKSKPEQGSIHIPMVIDASRLGGRPGVCASAPAELQDLTATFLDYAGVQPKFEMESVSLRGVAEGTQTAVREFAISELICPNRMGPLRSFAAITDGRWKLILDNSAAQRLYDLKADPFEHKNLAEQHPQEIDRLRKGFMERGEKLDPVVLQYIKAFYGG